MRRKTNMQQQQPVVDNNKKILKNIVFTLVLSIIGTGILVPTQPKLVTKLTQTHDQGAFSYGLLVSMATMIQFFVSPILGALSDSKRFGRRRILLFQISCTMMYYLCLVIADFTNQMNYVVAGRIFNGVSGSILQTSFTILSDVTEASEDRSKKFGLVGMAFGVGFTFGPMIGGILSKVLGNLHGAFILAFVMSACSLLYAFKTIHETLPVTDNKEEAAFFSKVLNPFSSFKLLFSSRTLIIYTLIIFTSGIANQGFYSVFVHYSSYRYQFTTATVGYYMTLIGIGFAMIQGYGLKKIVSRFGEHNSHVLSYIVYTILYIHLGLASSGSMCFAAITYGCFGGMAEPIIKSLMSRHVDTSSQGALQGTISSVNLLTKAIASAVSTYAFQYFTSDRSPVYLPGAPFFLSAVLSAVSVLFAVYISRGVTHHKTS